MTKEMRLFLKEMIDAGKEEMLLAFIAQEQVSLTEQEGAGLARRETNEGRLDALLAVVAAACILPGFAAALVGLYSTMAFSVLGKVVHAQESVNLIRAYLKELEEARNYILTRSGSVSEHDSPQETGFQIGFQYFCGTLNAETIASGRRKRSARESTLVVSAITTAWATLVTLHSQAQMESVLHLGGAAHGTVWAVVAVIGIINLIQICRIFSLFNEKKA